MLANNAKYIIAVGTCASFKGVSGAGSNITGVMSVENVLSQNNKSKVINLPGCPVHPYIIGGTIMNLIMDNQLQLDSLRRPTLYYSSKNYMIKKIIFLIVL
ncbi:hypothetical protein PL321_07435 [Caloramator sp. mosi_1]|uniref:NADH-quinone oxidoreductase subunit B family protein n=1 Tax=Caloramator sp. mosi_1 TaxID=3023090 RepID=UPI002362ADA5|nr:hypothetical protein [Caloramator sp. mosi_1]WDC85270.1 hypothetical protein PL321_07435 [Caloramator sp. mosi_1]